MTFLRVTVARGDRLALGDAGNRIVCSDPTKVDRRWLVMALSPVAPRTKKGGGGGADAKGVLDQTLQ